MITVGSMCAIICTAFCVVISIGVFIVGAMEKEWSCILIGSITLIISVSGLFACSNIEHNTTIYIPAEPIAYNQTQTVFTTDEGTYIADGLYPNGTYLLTVDGKDVLVVWQAVDGEVE